MASWNLMTLYRVWRRLWIAFSLLLAASIAQAIALPGGKANYVVAVGDLHPVATPEEQNQWVRLSYYQFNINGTVTNNYWFWTVFNEVQREFTNILTNCNDANVPTCNIQTAEGFLGDPTGGFIGTYSYDPSGRLVIVWDRKADGTIINPLKEYWNIDAGLALGKMARIRSAHFYSTSTPTGFSNYSAKYGIGYGSNAAFSSSTRASMTQLNTDVRYKDKIYQGKIQVATKSGTQGAVFYNGTGGYPYGGYKACTSGPCLGWTQPVDANECGTCSGSESGRARYVAQVAGGRRNTEWFWCRCLANRDAPCYYANNHVRPSLQIIDDGGVFQGWVGVETMSHVDPATLILDQNFVASHFGVFDIVDWNVAPIPSN
jgi:hypothetical protein